MQKTLPITKQSLIILKEPKYLVRHENIETNKEQSCQYIHNPFFLILFSIKKWIIAGQYTSRSVEIISFIPANNSIDSSSEFLPSFIWVNASRYFEHNCNFALRSSSFTGKIYNHKKGVWFFAKTSKWKFIWLQY